MTTRTRGSYLRCFVHEDRKHHGRLLYERLREQGKTMGIPRDTAFRAIADFGRRKVMRGRYFFELAGEALVRVDFLVTSVELEHQPALVDAERLKVPYAVFPVEFGITTGEH